METLGRYRILGELGRGGCGIVYSALDPGIGRKVAIKTIHAEGESAMGDSLRERFRREAHAAGMLSHPNIVTIHEFSETDDAIYIVMEFVEGQTLAQRMESEGPLPLEFVLSVVRSAAGALDSAHAHDIVHRDVKPANFLITGGGFLKVTDFGIAKVHGDISLTHTGMLIGTAQYMSPEQVQAAPVTGRSDQFSLAVIAYEMLTGRKPFQGDSWASVLNQIMTAEPPPVEQFREGLSDAVTGVLRRALAKDPALRYSTCVQFADEFTQAVMGTTIERTMLAPIVQALKGPLPPPLTGFTDAQSAGPETTGTKLMPAPPEKPRSVKTPLLIGASVPLVLLGGWLILRSRPQPPQMQTPAYVAESKTAGATAPAAETTPVAKDKPETNPSVSAVRKNDTPASPQPSKTQVASTASSPARTPALPQPPPVLVAAATPVVVPAPSVPVEEPPPAAARPAPAKSAPTPEPPSAVQSAPPAAPSRSPEAEAWDRVRGSADIRALEQFRQAYPAGAFSAEAGARIEQLEWDRARQANDAKSYRDFLARHPSGTFSDRAKTELAKLDGAAEIAAARRQVDEALRRYRAAFEDKDAEGLKALWPSLSRAELSSFQSFFRIARTVKLQLAQIGEAEVSGDRASVRCRRTMTAADERGPMPSQDQMVEIRLRKSGGAMVIESIDVVK